MRRALSSALVNHRTPRWTRGRYSVATPSCSLCTAHPLQGSSGWGRRMLAHGHSATVDAMHGLVEASRGTCRRQMQWGWGHVSSALRNDPHLVRLERIAVPSFVAHTADGERSVVATYSTSPNSHPGFVSTTLCVAVHLVCPEDLCYPQPNVLAALVILYCSFASNSTASSWNGSLLQSRTMRTAFKSFSVL